MILAWPRGASPRWLVEVINAMQHGRDPEAANFRLGSHLRPCSGIGWINVGGVSAPSTVRFPNAPLLGLFGLAASLLSGCSPQSPGPRPEPELPERFSGTGTEAVADRWWTAFDDRALNGLEQRALEGNFSLESSWQRLRQARAVAARERSGLFPDLDALADGRATRGSDSTEQLGLGFAASYEVDLWGRIRSQSQAEALRAEASLADYRAAAVSLSAEVARTWYGLVEAWEQHALIERQVATNEKILRQLRVRVAKGQGRAVDLLRQEQLVRATREQLTIVEGNAGVLANRLAVLQGDTPRSSTRPGSAHLPALPPPPSTGLPIRLLQRRPDVLSAFYRLRAADAELAAAISNRYPRLTLDSSVATAKSDTAGLFDDWLATLAGSLVAPLLDGGERAAEVSRTRARRAEVLADYRQTVLEAIREVEDNLLLERTQRVRINELSRQVDLAERSSRQLIVSYLNGGTDFIDVLTSLRTEQELRRDLLTARRTLIEIRIALYRALAGGFKTTRES